MKRNGILPIANAIIGAVQHAYSEKGTPAQRRVIADTIADMLIMSLDLQDK